MRMFIGQRGNNASSKPCPPPFSEGICKTTPARGSRQAKVQRKHEEDKADARQRRTAPSVSASTTPTRVASAAVSDDCNAGADEDARAESEARAEAVAALGMLFSQSGDVKDDAREIGGPNSSSDSSIVASRQGMRAVEGRLPIFSVGVAARA